jgi:DNA-binding MarR family transcriptional regulator
MPRLTSNEFFLGFFAALKKAGCLAIRTKDDDHQKRFQLLRDALPELGARYPSFVPSPFTGRVQELDDALLQLQTGVLGAKNPFYPKIDLDISDTLAARILKDLTAEDRELFQKLAEKFQAAEGRELAA